MVEPIESKRRSRTTLVAATIGVVLAALLVAYGFSRADDDRQPDTDIPPTIGVIQAPAEVSATSTTLSAVVISSPDTVDVPVIPADTADVALPPITAGTLVP